MRLHKTGGTVPASSQPKLLFGLALDDKFRWATAEGYARGNDAPAIENIRVGSIDIVKARDVLTLLNDKLSDIAANTLRRADGIGVSTIGVVNPRGQLVNIARKEWLREHDDYIIDFCQLFGRHLPKKSGLRDKILVQNDATAAALAEYRYAWRDDLPFACRRLLYLTFGEGVNGGIIYSDHPLPMGVHPEMGHIPAVPDDADPIKLDKSPCKAHGLNCYEGIASGARIRRTWGRNISELEDNHIAWQLQASYVAKLVLAGTLTVTPERVVLGGSVMNEHLLKLVRADFNTLNMRYLPLRLDGDLIHLGSCGDNANILGALELAWLAAANGTNAPIGPARW